MNLRSAPKDKVTGVNPRQYKIYTDKLKEIKEICDQQDDCYDEEGEGEIETCKFWDEKTETCLVCWEGTNPGEWEGPDDLYRALNNIINFCAHDLEVEELTKDM